ncbi:MULTISPECIES: PIN domain-containing protein [unclassified Mesorhizobium]|uniref:PIN domain-containing protein n=1 Tax=unclassified Mesorhizobium TaxID=325217 RepID=UPI003014A635
MFILDTNVLSQFAYRKPHPGILSWLQNLSASVAIPFGAVIEIQRGIEKLSLHDSVRSSALQEWLQSLLVSDIPFLGMDAPTAQLYARMTAVPALRDFWMPPANAKTPKLGQDLSIAATAIIHNAPIATMNTKDFLRINGFFPLPGVFDPAAATWSVAPANWGIHHQPVCIQ